MTDDGILADIEAEVSAIAPDDDAGDVPDRDGVYHPTDDADDREGVRFPWPDVEPVQRTLTAEEWGVNGEGPPAAWDEFVATLNAGRLGAQPARLKPEGPDWGQTPMPVARSAQKPRGKHLFCHVGATLASVLRAQGQAGASDYRDKTAEEFVYPLEPKVLDYAERFEAGDRPGSLFVFLTSDGAVQGPQEGRHRSAAAHLAGLEWAPLVILWETGGTFRRPTSYNNAEPGEDYRKRYPETA